MSLGIYATEKQMARAASHRLAAIQLTDEQADELAALLDSMPISLNTWGKAYAVKDALLASMMFNAAASKASSDGDNAYADEYADYAAALSRFVKKVAAAQ